MLVTSILKAEDDKKLFVRIRNNKAEEFDAKIDLTGASDKIQKVYEDCNKKLSITKEKKLEKVEINEIPSTEKTVITKKSIESGSKQQLIDRFTDLGYVNSSFPQNESFWVAIKSPPPNSDIYAKMVCKIAKTEYGLKGFVVTIWGFDRKKYGKYGCY